MTTRMVAKSANGFIDLADPIEGELVRSTVKPEDMPEGKNIGVTKQLYAKPWITLELNNLGIGDSSFIHRDRQLKSGLNKFANESYELIVLPPEKFQMCGGYKYQLLIFNQVQEIKAFVEMWESGELDDDDLEEVAEEDKF